MEDFDQYIKKDGLFCLCTICGGMRNKSITNVRCHIESKHFPGIFSYTCAYCDKLLYSKVSHRDHTNSCKRNSVYAITNNQL